MIWYALTIFWSAFLLFLVQPILGKQILPWFGGTPAVWTTCLLFFQVLLLGGYVYAHGLSAWLKPRGQALVHITLLAASLWFLPIVTDSTYRGQLESSPTWQILVLLTATIGAPYFLMSATGPLLQAWFSRTHTGSPYRLYALSNVGSLLALLSYPFLVEPNLRLGVQTHWWSWGYAAFAVFCTLCAVQLAIFRRPRSEHNADRGSEEPSHREQDQNARRRVGLDGPVAGPGRERLGDALGHDESNLPGSRRRAVFVDSAADTLFALVHHLLRQSALVRPAHVSQLARGFGGGRCRHVVP